MAVGGWIFRGLGVALGGMIAGPVGAALGGVLGTALGGAIDGDAGGHDGHSVAAGDVHNHVDISDNISIHDVVDTGSWGDAAPFG